MAKKFINNEVYNTETGKSYKVHPDMLRDKKWLASRGLVVQERVEPVQATNLPTAPDVELKAPAATSPATKVNTTKGGKNG